MSLDPKIDQLNQLSSILSELITLNQPEIQPQTNNQKQKSFKRGHSQRVLKHIKIKASPNMSIGTKGHGQQDQKDSKHLRYQLKATFLTKRHRRLQKEYQNYKQKHWISNSIEKLEKSTIKDLKTQLWSLENDNIKLIKQKSVYVGIQLNYQQTEQYFQKVIKDKGPMECSTLASFYQNDSLIGRSSSKEGISHLKGSIHNKKSKQEIQVLNTLINLEKRRLNYQMKQLDAIYTKLDNGTKQPKNNSPYLIQDWSSRRMGSSKKRMNNISMPNCLYSGQITPISRSQDKTCPKSTTLKNEPHKPSIKNKKRRQLSKILSSNQEINKSHFQSVLDSQIYSSKKARLFPSVFNSSTNQSKNKKNDNILVSPFIKDKGESPPNQKSDQKNLSKTEKTPIKNTGNINQVEQIPKHSISPLKNYSFKNHPNHKNSPKLDLSQITESITVENQQTLYSDSDGNSSLDRSSKNKSKKGQKIPILKLPSKINVSSPNELKNDIVNPKLQESSSKLRKDKNCEDKIYIKSQTTPIINNQANNDIIEEKEEGNGDFNEEDLLDSLPVQVKNSKLKFQKTSPIPQQNNFDSGRTLKSSIRNFPGEKNLTLRFKFQEGSEHSHKDVLSHKQSVDELELPKFQKFQSNDTGYLSAQKIKINKLVNSSMFHEKKGTNNISQSLFTPQEETSIIKILSEKEKEDAARVAKYFPIFRQELGNEGENDIYEPHEKGIQSQLSLSVRTFIFYGLSL